MQSKKIAFFLKSDELGYTDFSHVEKGNPGVGGSEYMIVLIAHLLNSRNNGIDVTLYTLSDGVFPQGLRYKIVSSLKDAIVDAESSGYDYLTFKYKHFYTEDGSLDFQHLNVKLMPWCHNFATARDLSYFSRNPNIYKIICVGKEQMEVYLDHKAYDKSIYIYNAVNTECIQKYNVRSSDFVKRKNIVTYVGSIVPVKGFHWLAEVWARLLKIVPDAELHVIGSGKLYQRDAHLGKNGIAESEYENYLMKYLSCDGEILPSVHFHGIMGEEKNEILLQTKVGVPNPSGKTETFGITAVEMQLMGCVVSTIECEGYLDTVFGGFMYKKKKDFLPMLVNALRAQSNNYETNRKLILQKFSHSAVISQWEELVLTGTLKQNRKIDNIYFNYKWVKLAMYKIKKRIPFLYKVIPSVDDVVKKSCGLKIKFLSFFLSKDLF